MTWVDDMKRDAVALAFPSWEWQEGDEVDIFMDYDPGYSTLTPGDGFTFTVTVKRGSIYHGYDADTEFFHRLMTKGSGL